MQKGILTIWFRFWFVMGACAAAGAPAPAVGGGAPPAAEGPGADIVVIRVGLLEAGGGGHFVG